MLGASSIGATLSTVLTEKVTSDAASSLISSDSTWFKLNAGQTGFYRVNYTVPQWQALVSHLASFTPSDRLGLISDAYALFKVRKHRTHASVHRWVPKFWTH